MSMTTVSSNVQVVIYTNIPLYAHYPFNYYLNIRAIPTLQNSFWTLSIVTSLIRWGRFQLSFSPFPTENIANQLAAAPEDRWTRAKILLSKKWCSSKLCKSELPTIKTRIWVYLVLIVTRKECGGNTSYYCL